MAYGAGKPGLNLTNLRELLVALPPLDEQRRIVAEVERRLSVVGEVESAVEVGLVRGGKLRQAVLRSAFEGRL
jgi:type I restriction enzyme S subunit